MFFEIERINKIVEELNEQKYVKKVEMTDVVYKKIKAFSPEEASVHPDEWCDFEPGGRWGRDSKYAWFKSSIEIDEQLAGKKLIYRVITGKEGGWDIHNPQFLAFVNGSAKQGMDINHTEFLLTDHSILGERFDIELQAYNGSLDTLSECEQAVLILDDTIEKLYYDLMVPLEACKLLPKQDKDRIDTLKCLTKAVNRIDMRIPYTQGYYQSIHEAIQCLEEEYYSKLDPRNNVVARCVGHTHIDVAWLWDLEQTRQKVRRSFATVLELMKQYDDYIFMSSQPQNYTFIKEDDPQMYEEIKERIKEGRWEPEGAMWVEADCNLSSGESLVRQVLLGKKYFRDEFDKESKILWLPDVFGYSAALPQILKKSSVDYFMTTKISWNEYNKLPYDTFDWVGLDGTKILSHFITTANFDDLPEKFMTTYNGNIDVNSVKGAWERYQQKDISDEVLISYGYGDGGGGPTKKMLETAKRLEQGVKGVPTVKLSTATEFFEKLDENVSDNKKLPRWVGELYFEYHRGTLTSMARNKRYNRKSEFLYEDLEWASSMAKIINNTPYPTEIIDKGWEIICLNQFHDIIPGSSIKKVYEDSKEQYEEIIQIGEATLQSRLEGIAKEVATGKKAVVVFNSLSFERYDLVRFEYPNPVVIYDDGQEIESVYEEGYVAFYGTIPSKGYKSFEIVDRDLAQAPIDNTLILSKQCLENQFFKIQLDETGCIVSLFDKKEAREVLIPGQRGNVLQAFEDKPHNWDAWDINIYYQEKMWEIEDVQSIEVESNNGLEGTLCIKRKFMNSTIIQRMHIYRDIPRVDFENDIDWKETHILLKAAFPVDIHTEKAVYDIQFGNVERPTHWNTSWDIAKFEVCGHKWADLSEGNYGVSLMNDCKYGYDIKDQNMRLTLLKSPTIPNEDADRERHQFVYSLYPHKGDFKIGGTNQEAYKLNVELYVQLVEGVSGKLPAKLSVVDIDQDNVVCEVLKESQDEGYVLRVYEVHNKRTQCNIKMFKALATVVECDLEERAIGDVEKVEGQQFSFEIKPFEIKTYKITFA